jgi:hypothetical protein
LLLVELQPEVRDIFLGWTFTSFEVLPEPSTGLLLALALGVWATQRGGMASASHLLDVEAKGRAIGATRQSR